MMMHQKEKSFPSSFKKWEEKLTMEKKRNLLSGGFLAFSLMHLAAAQSAGTTGLTSSQFKRGQKKEFQAINDFDTSNWIEKTDTPPPSEAAMHSPNGQSDSQIH